MDSRRRKKNKMLKSKQLKMLNEYYRLPEYKRILRFVKENRCFYTFIQKIMAKHNLKFQQAVNFVKEHPNIIYLIGYYDTNLDHYHFKTTLDVFTANLIEKYNKFNPLFVNKN